ncbi:MAG TPA: DUF721 domain-containing protein [Acidimicrobiales bacterium]|nr:DUF721 domain-containing protein [Acidimicrobiales bacterium]
MSDSREPNNPKRQYRSRRPNQGAEQPTHLLGSSVESMLQFQGLGSAALLARIINLWPSVVGERMNAHATPSKIDGKELIVSVDHPAWATEIRMQSSRIVSQLESELKSPLINRLKVHVLPSNDLD